MKKLEVSLAERSYEILIGSGILDRAGEIIVQQLGRRRAAVLTDSTVWGIWGGVLEKSLRAQSIDFFTVIVLPGENSKSFESLSSLLEQMAHQGLTRSDLLIAFGGGVVGDLGGFAASVYMRGIQYVQIPTTLLAQVDSSVGGKTAVNLMHGKNLAGCFWQPSLVISDTNTLTTLPEREFAGGMAEVIKYGAIRSKELFDMISRHPSPEEIYCHMTDIIYQCCDIKRQMVQRDERDAGERMLLNFGHTFGHAIEKIGGFEKYIHGEAVAMGMVLAAGYGERLGMTPESTAEQIGRLCAKFGLPADESIDPALIAPLVSLDKKADGSRIRIILIREIGEAFIYTTMADEFSEIISSLGI